MTGEVAHVNLRLSNLQKIKPELGKCEMYVRFIVKYYNQQTKREETGVFRAADYVRDFSVISADEKENLRELIGWFDEHLPVPEFYDDPTKRGEENHTYFWFKTDATEFLGQMNALTEILERNGVKTEKLCAERVPGELIFEDYCQIVVVPFEDVLRIK